MFPKVYTFVLSCSLRKTRTLVLFHVTISQEFCTNLYNFCENLSNKFPRSKRVLNELKSAKAIS
jgi:hypothetical protein